MRAAALASTSEGFRRAIPLPAATSGPTSAKILYNLGTALAQESRHREAIPQYIEALRLRPDHAKAHNNLGWSLMKLGRLDEESRFLHQLLDERPGGAGALPPGDENG